MSGRGFIGAEHLQGQAAEGVLFLVIVLCAGGVLLLTGARRWRRPDGALPRP